VKFDAEVVIVGGGPAGTTTALALAHAAPHIVGRSILLEQARYPRDKPCAGAVGARGDLLLRRLGVKVDVPSVPIDGISFRGAESEAVAVPRRIGRVVRRIEFDHALAEAARSRGVEVRDGVRVRQVSDHPDGGGVVRTDAGDLRARVVVGCDGVSSVVRKSLEVGAGSLRAQVVEVDTEPTATDRDRSLLHFDSRDRRLSGYAWDFPTLVDGASLVCRGVYRLRFGEHHDAGIDVGQALDERLRGMGLDPTRYKTKRYAERGYDPSAPIAAGSRMLVGEAAGIDPVTGEGIAQAIEYGAMAGAFLARVLDGGGSRLEVESWGHEVSRSRLAWDLRMRIRAMRLFYGPHRSHVERCLTESPDAIFVGCQHFAAQDYDWLRVAEVAGRASARLAAVKIGEALAS
jgi:flavin-dependent dehydrogenase